MVVSARMAAGLSGLRNRNARVTNKTLLRVIRGNLEADPLILDEEEDEKNRILASQGVDEEDANEHHLQAALSAYSQRTVAQKTESEQTAFIPTPDAAGVVANYDELYPRNRYKDPATHIRFSDSIDESCIGGLAGGFSYFMDERDAGFLTSNNARAKGEGTSTGVNGKISGRATTSRVSKGKGKEPEQSILQPSIEIDEDVFELVMGLFEKWTDEHVSPYLHLSTDPEHFPDFSEYNEFLSNPLPLHTFANFQPPSYVPPPDKLLQVARIIYPWWRERRLERKGERVAPQLHVLVLEAQEKEDRAGSSPYTCFRKRDVKPVRKTRTNTASHTDKLTRLRVELVSGLELAQMVLEREKLKRETAQVNQSIWRSREALAEYMKQLNAVAPGSIPPMDEQLLLDKERKPTKPTKRDVPGRIILAPSRRHIRTGSVDPHSPLSITGDMVHNFEEGQKWPSLRYQAIQKEIDKDLAKARKDDSHWEENLDLSFVAPPVATADKYFKAVPPLTVSGASQVGHKPDGDRSPLSHRAPHAMRLRVGRGGRKHLDRVGHLHRYPPLLDREWAQYPLRKEEVDETKEDHERWAFRDWCSPSMQRPHPRSQRRLGELYLSRPSVYDVPSDATPTSEFENVTGFGLGPDTLVTESRQMLLLSRRDDEGWKPTPHLAVDPETAGPEEAARNAAERDRIVEAWRGNTATATGGGGALALFTDGTPGDGENGQMGSPDSDSWSRPESRTESWEFAARVEERWRYDDAEGRGASGQDGEERFILDNYQPKYLRTTITLLDDHDHEAMTVDPQLIPPLPSIPDRYEDHRLRLQHQALPPLSSNLMPPSIPYRPIPVPTPVSSQANISSSLGAQVRPVATDANAIVSHNIQSSSTINAQNGSTSGGNPVQGTTSPKLNGVHVNGGARLPPDSGPAVRGNTPMRTKQTVNGVSLPYQIPGTTEGTGTSTDVQMNGPMSTSTAQKAQAYSIGQPTQVQVVNGAANGTGASGINHANFVASLGTANFPLKLPPQKAARLNGDTHVADVPANGQNKDSQTTQPVTIPQLPPSGTSAA